MSEATKPIDDGGPAFPTEIVVRTVCNTGELVDSTVYGVGGMSLRDYLAGQALAFLAHPARIGVAFKPKGDAEFAYAVADAMLAARKGASNAL